MENKLENIMKKTALIAGGIVIACGLGYYVLKNNDVIRGNCYSMMRGITEELRYIMGNSIRR